jgi:hypothetical protein
VLHYNVVEHGHGAAGPAYHCVARAGEQYKVQASPVPAESLLFCSNKELVPGCAGVGFNPRIHVNLLGRSNLL